MKRENYFDLTEAQSFKRFAIEALAEPGVVRQFKLFLRYPDGEAIACRYLETVANPPEITEEDAIELEKKRPRGRPPGTFKKRAA